MNRRFVLTIAAALCFLALLTCAVAHRQPTVRGKPVGEWLEELGSDSSTRRAAAEAAIRELGTNSIPWLIRELGRKDFAPITFLLSLVSKQSFFEIEVKDADAHHDHALAGFELVGSNAQAAIPGLISLLAADHASYEVIQAIQYVGPSAIAPLTKCLEERNPVLRRNAAEALEGFGPDAASAVWALLKLEQDSQPDVRVASASALGSIAAEPKCVVPVLMRLVRDSTADVRTTAAYGLANFEKEAESAVDALLALLDDAAEHPKHAAAFALGQIGCNGDRVVPSLIARLATGTSSTRCSLLRSMGGFPEESRISIPVLLNAANDPSTEVRSAAISSLGTLKCDPATVVPFLTRCLQDSNANVRYQSALALGEFGEFAAPAVSALYVLLKDESLCGFGCMPNRVRSGAERALLRIRPESLLAEETR